MLFSGWLKMRLLKVCCRMIDEIENCKEKCNETVMKSVHQNADHCGMLSPDELCKTVNVIYTMYSAS